MNILLHLPHHFMALLHIHFSHVCERTCVCIYLIIIVNNGEKVSPSIRVRIAKEFISPFFCIAAAAADSHLHLAHMCIESSKKLLSFLPLFTRSLLAILICIFQQGFLLSLSLFFISSHLLYMHSCKHIHEVDLDDDAHMVTLNYVTIISSSSSSLR